MNRASFMRGKLFWKIFLSYVGIIAMAAAVDHWLGIALAVAFGLYVARRITRPLRELTLTAEALRYGDYSRRIHQLPPNEFGILGAALNQLGSTVATKIATIHQERSQLWAIIAEMTEGVIAVEHGGRVLLCNHAASRLLGTTEADMLGKPLWEITRVADLVELFEQARQGSGAIAEEIAITPPSANLLGLTVQAHASRFAGGNENGVVIVLNDVTQLKRLERVRQDFVANVSHELKTPLTAIRGYVETVLQLAQGETEPRERFLRKVDSQVSRLIDLIEELLALARVEASDAEHTVAAVEWRSVIGEVVSHYEPTIAEHHLRIVAELSQVEAWVLGNREALSMIVSNLLDNAIKYSRPHGEIRLLLHAAEQKITLSVIDTGIGIPRHEHARIFERFYRVEKSRTSGPAGSGLGLAIVKHLVQTLKGEVGVDSTEGQGSRFHVTLPRAVVTPTQHSHHVA